MEASGMECCGWGGGLTTTSTSYRFVVCKTCHYWPYVGVECVGVYNAVHAGHWNLCDVYLVQSCHVQSCVAGLCVCILCSYVCGRSLLLRVVVNTCMFVCYWIWVAAETYIQLVGYGPHSQNVCVDVYTSDLVVIFNLCDQWLEVITRGSDEVLVTSD